MNHLSFQDTICMYPLAIGQEASLLGLGFILFEEKKYVRLD